jgi:hypothetical protein
MGAARLKSTNGSMALAGLICGSVGLLIDVALIALARS